MNNEEDFEDFNVVVVFLMFLRLRFLGALFFVLCFLFLVCVCVWLKG